MNSPTKRTEPVQFTLVNKDIEFLLEYSFQKDFTFIVGGNKYPCYKVAAAALSPSVANILLIQKTFSEFIIPVNDEGNKFSQVMKIMYGHTVEINKENAEFMYEVGKCLGNIDLMKTAERFQPFITKKNFDKTIITNFTITDAQIDTIDFNTVNEILSKMIIDSTNNKMLFDMIVKFVHKRGQYFAKLFKFVKFEFLKESDVALFFDLMPLELIDLSLWNAIRARMVCPATPTVTETDYIFTNDPLNGVLAKNKTVKLTASSIGGNRPWQLADRSFDAYFFTDSEESAWVMADFGGRFLPSRYSLRTYESAPDSQHLRSWVLQGSNDIENGLWTVLDEVTDYVELNGPLNVFSSPLKPSNPFRYIRLRMTGRCHAGLHTLILNAIEFFGVLTSQ